MPLQTEKREITELAANRNSSVQELSNTLFPSVEDDLNGSLGRPIIHCLNTHYGGENHPNG